MSNDVQVQEKKNHPVVAMIKSNFDKIKEAMPQNLGLTPENMIRIALTEMRNNRNLHRCSPQSILGAIIMSTQLGLPFQLGQAWLIPYKDEANFQIGWQGLKELVYRSDKVSLLYGESVHENDEFDFELGLNPTLKHKPAKVNRGNEIGYYVVVKTKDDSSFFQYMSKDDVEKHRQQYSKMPNSPAWKSSFKAMALKTVFIQLSKWLPRSVSPKELQIATQRDNMTINAEIITDHNEDDFLGITAKNEYEDENAGQEEEKETEKHKISGVSQAKANVLNKMPEKKATELDAMPTEMQLEVLALSKKDDNMTALNEYLSKKNKSINELDDNECSQNRRSKDDEKNNAYIDNTFLRK